MCRQVDGCYNQIREFFAGTGGTTWGNGGTKPTDAKEIAVPDFQEHGGPYVQEHVDLLDSIRKGEPLNEARAVAESTMTGIMGRISAYTGKLVRWHDLMNNEKSALYNLKLTPAAEAFESGDVVAPPDDIVAVPGRD